MSFFQNDLDEAIIQREATLKAEIVNIFNNYNLNFSLIENGTGGILTNSYSSLPGIEALFNSSIVCSSNTHISQLLDIPQAQIDSVKPASFCRLLLESLYVKTKSILCLAIMGKVKKKDHSDTCDVTIQFGYKFNRSVQIKSMFFSAHEKIIYNKIFETSLGFLKYFLVNELKSTAVKNK
jgi:nicotinamide mononucleotide (NMN) deamidase PncC